MVVFLYFSKKFSDNRGKLFISYYLREVATITEENITPHKIIILKNEGRGTNAEK